METCSAKEQPSFLTHLCCLLSLCQSGTVCVCFGVLSTHVVFGWQLAVVQDSTHCGVCAFHSSRPPAFSMPSDASPCATCDPGVHAGRWWGIFSGWVCVFVCVMCLRGLLENVRPWCSPGGRLDRRFLPLWSLLCSASPHKAQRFTAAQGKQEQCSGLIGED